MRVLLAFASLVLAASTARADSAPLLVKLDPPRSRSLAAAEVEDHMKPMHEQIGRCYVAAAGDVRGAGRLEITLAIARRGTVDSVAVATPKLPPRAARQVAGCVRAVVEGLEFPARRAPTTAMVPYFYQRTDAPGAGPQLSCWNPKGCKAS